jgi:hypothetical protein
MAGAIFGSELLPRSRPEKLGPCWWGPLQVASALGQLELEHQANSKLCELPSSKDLIIKKPDVEVSQQRKCRVGLTI